MYLVVHIPYQADEESSRALSLASNCKTSLSRSLGGSVGGDVGHHARGLPMFRRRVVSARE